MPGHIRKRGKKSYRVCVSAGFNQSGKRIQVWRTVRGTRKDAERVLSRLQHEAHTGALVDPGRATVREWLDRWLVDIARPNVASKTFERYEQVLRLHLIPALGAIPLARLHPSHVQRLYTDLLERGRHPRTVLHVHRVLHTSLEAAVRQQVVGRNVCDAATPPRVRPSEKRRALTEAEVAQVLHAAEGTRLHTPAALGSLCGLRRGEVLGLRWEDVDFERAAIHVRHSLEETREGVRLKETKTSRARPVALPPTVVGVLRSHRSRQAIERLQAGPAWQDSGLVCCGPRGGPWRPSDFSDEFAAFARTLRILPHTFQDLRHSHGSHLVRRGVDVRTVAARLGHSTPTLTLNTYAHLMPGAQEEAALRVERVIRDALGKLPR